MGRCRLRRGRSGSTLVSRLPALLQKPTRRERPVGAAAAANGAVQAATWPQWIDAGFAPVGAPTETVAARAPCRSGGSRERGRCRLRRGRSGSTLVSRLPALLQKPSRRERPVGAAAAANGAVQAATWPQWIDAGFAPAGAPTETDVARAPCRSGGSREWGGAGCDVAAVDRRWVRACRRSYRNRRGASAL